MFDVVVEICYFTHHLHVNVLNALSTCNTNYDILTKYGLDPVAQNIGSFLLSDGFLSSVLGAGNTAFSAFNDSSLYRTNTVMNIIIGGVLALSFSMECNKVVVLCGCAWNSPFCSSQFHQGEWVESCSASKLVRYRQQIRSTNQHP